MIYHIHITQVEAENMKDKNRNREESITIKKKNQLSDRAN